jgi:hypothetical protein
MMEKTHVDAKYATRLSQKWLPYGHYVVRNAQEHVAKYTVWKKEKSGPDGYLFTAEDKYTPVMSVELVEIPNKTYNNLLVDELPASDAASTIHTDILANGLSVTPTFNEMYKTFDRSAESISDRLPNIPPGPPTKEQVSQLPVIFHSTNVDSRCYISIQKLRQLHPEDFVSWKCTGKSKGHWVSGLILEDSIILNTPVLNTPALVTGSTADGTVIDLKL